MFNKAAFDEKSRQFGKFLKDENPPLSYWFLAQQKFQQKWNPQVLNASNMMDEALDESTENWSITLNEAKRVLIAFAKMNDDLLLAMFKDLFDEQKALDGRIDRFIFHLDLLLSELNQKKVIYPDHLHNKKVITTYLTYRLPGLYLPFDYEYFYKTMETLKALKIPTEFEIDRYYKICRIMTKFLLKEDDVRNYYENYIDIQNIENQLIAYDFMVWCAS